jgi:hypothetical protein
MSEGGVDLIRSLLEAVAERYPTVTVAPKAGDVGLAMIVL